MQTYERCEHQMVGTSMKRTNSQRANSRCCVENIERFFFYRNIENVCEFEVTNARKMCNTNNDWSFLTPTIAAADVLKFRYFWARRSIFERYARFHRCRRRLVSSTHRGPLGRCDQINFHFIFETGHAANLD